MYVSASNPVINKVLSDFMMKELYDYQEVAYDTDNVIYKIYGIEDLKQFRFCFKCNCSTHILQNGGQAMLEERYKDHLLPAEEQDPEFDITLAISCEGMPQTKKVKKSMSEEQQEQVREENEKIRADRKTFIDPICERFSVFKMEFMSAPIRYAFNQGLAGKSVAPIEVAYREDEKYWIMMPTNNDIQVYFSVNFTNETDQSLGRVMLLEWQDSQRKIKAAPHIKFYDKEMPNELTKAFPHIIQEKYSNGMISFKVNVELHLKGKSMEQPLSMLAGFRQYVQYHLHAMKTFLHSRMRERVECFERVINMAKRVKEGPKNWKETHGGITEEERELKEKAKIEEVYVHK